MCNVGMRYGERRRTLRRQRKMKPTAVAEMDDDELPPPPSPLSPQITVVDADDEEDADYGPIENGIEKE